MFERTQLVLFRRKFRTYRGMAETRDRLNQYGVKYSITAGLILRRLPTDNFMALEKLLIAIAKRRGAFTLTGLPTFPQIVGIPNKDIPDIKWKLYSREAEPHCSRGDILGHFIHAYLDNKSNTLDLSMVAGFNEYMKQRLGVEQFTLRFE